jgi:hypothetical protein
VISTLTLYTKVYKTNSKTVVDKDLEIPLSFIIGSIISALTLVGLILWFKK